MYLYNCLCTFPVFDEQYSLDTDFCEFLWNMSYGTFRTIDTKVHIKQYQTERTEVAKQCMKRLFTSEKYKMILT